LPLPTDSAASSQTGQSTRRVDWLDALRGWAVLAVVCVHSGPVAHSKGLTAQVTSAGQYGVQLFFVVSALTISLTYESHIARYGRTVQSQFAWLIKRFFRIAPLYYLAAIFYPVEQYAIYLASHHRYGGTTSLLNILANFLFLQTWVPSANNSVVPGGWSIGVEMFFYLLVPLIWLIAPIRKRIVVLCAGGLAGLLLTVLVNRLVTGSFYVVNDSYLYFWFPAQASVIIVGLILYFACGPGLWLSARRSNGPVYFVCSLMFFALALALGTVGEIAPVFAPVVFAMSFVLLVLALQGWLGQLIVNRFAIALGKISYSVYIFHFFVLDCLRAVFQSTHLERIGPFTLPVVLLLAVIVTSGIASLSKRFIEDPSVDLGHRLGASIMSGKPLPSSQQPAAESI
jgi:peptidoglycan/LPS O-acetylase OafA/YrhL